MKHSIVFFSLMVSFCACQPSATHQEAATKEQQLPAEAAAAYGAAIAAGQGAASAEEVPALLQKQDSLYVRLQGVATSSCTKKGCWMMVDIGKEESMRVTFKDYAFFVPKDLNGEQVLVEGILKRTLSSVDDQRHYAEDAGKSPEEIQAIQQADTVYTFEAIGVKIWPLTKEG